MATSWSWVNCRLAASRTWSGTMGLDQRDHEKAAHCPVCARLEGDSSFSSERKKETAAAEDDYSRKEAE
jgi:hypothetical protein